MKKRLLSMVLALVMVLGMLPVAASAADGDFTITDGVLTSYTGSGGDVTIPDGVVSIRSFVFYNCSSLTGVTIPASVTRIEESAFEGCGSLERVVIPASVAYIGAGVFRGCSSLERIEVAEDNPAYTAVDGVLFSKDGTKLLAYPGGKKGAYDIPNGVTTILANAFSNCPHVTEVTIPASVTSIGDSTLASVMPEGAFKACGSLTAIHVSSQNQVYKEIDGVLFKIDTSVEGKLELVSYPGGKEGAYAIPDTVRTIWSEAFQGCSSLTSVAIPGSVGKIHKGTFQDCRSLARVTIPDSVIFIDTSAFRDCTSLASVSFPAQLNSINSYAFYGCSSLTGIDLPTNLFSIEAYAFYNCSSLTDVTIPQYVSSIKMSTFRGCTGLTSVTISNGVTSIENFAFYGCTGLTSVTIPAKVTSIGQSAFWKCDSLTEVHYGGSEEQWDAIDIGNNNDPLTNAERHYNSGPALPCTVSFDLNGAAGTMPDISVTVGQSYGPLPVLAGTDQIFSGWFTAADGGTEVTADTIVTNEADHTLYAHWRAFSPDNCLAEMKYHFRNAGEDFSYSENYKIPYERYAAIFGDTPRARQLYNSSAPWGGSCFGMSSTSAMFFQGGNGISPSAFNPTANRPYDLAVSDTNSGWGLTLREFIESMQISQKSQRINRHWDNGSLEELCTQVEAFQKSGRNPPVVCIWGSLDGTTGGHAMLAYRLDNPSETESRLMVYDPNYPDANPERYIRIDKSNGAYTGWYYHLNDTYDWGTGDPNAKIASIPYSDFEGIWTRKPVGYSLSDRAAALPAEFVEDALLIFNSDNAVILDSRGSRIAAVKNGSLETSRGDISLMIEVGVLPGNTVADSGNTALFLPPDLYTIKNTDSAVSDFKATLVHVEQSATVSTSGDTVTFAVDDETGINYAKVAPSGEPTSYTVTMESTLTKEDGTIETVTVSGTQNQGAPAAVTQLAGELFTENLGGASVKADGVEVPSSQVKDGGALDISKIIGATAEITAALQPDGSVLLSQAPANAQYVYAASYNSSGRMTGIVNGTLENSRITFNGTVAKGSQLFLLNANRIPVCGRITIR